MSAVLNATKILAVLVAQPSYVGDRSESLAAREELLRPVAEAIAEVARDNEEAAALIAQGWAETKWARAVLEYRCADLGRLACDRGKARGAFQVHGWCKGTGIVAEAKCTLRVMRYGKQRCHDHCFTPWHGAFAACASLPPDWAGADARVRTMKTILARLEKR